jgi:uncharacterized protein (DUF305 family)
MKTRTLVAALAALAAIAVAVIVVGLGDEDDTASASGNAADAAFITDMTAHHQGAIAMARVAQKRAEHPEIRRLADDIVTAQKGEISVMSNIRSDMHVMGEHSKAHMGMSDAEMGMDMDPAMLEDAEPFDRAFIDMMVPHHEGAIEMANQLLEHGQQPALRTMAHNIIGAQQLEILQMREWRKAWYGAAEGSDDAMGDHAH